MIRTAACFIALAAFAAPALADGETVQSLLAAGYTAVGVIPSQAGPGIFLQKGKDMYFCNVSETPNSPAVKTNYCKPVN